MRSWRIFCALSISVNDLQYYLCYHKWHDFVSLPRQCFWNGFYSVTQACIQLSFRSSQLSKYRVHKCVPPHWVLLPSFFFFDFILCIWVYVLPACVFTTCVPGACRGQRRALDSLEQKDVQTIVSLPCRCWELSLCPLDEQPVLVIPIPLSKKLSKLTWVCKWEPYLKILRL